MIDKSEFNIDVTERLWERVRGSFKVINNFQIVVPMIRSAVDMGDTGTKLADLDVITYRCVFGGYGGQPVARVFAHYPARANKAPCPVAIFRIKLGG